MTPETVKRAADDGLAEAERLVERAVTAPDPRTFESTLRPLGEAVAAVWRADGVGSFIGYVHPNAAVREAAGEMEERTEKWRAGLAKRDEVAAAVRAYADTEEAARLSGTRRRTLDLWLRDLRRAGHDLDPDARKEFARLENRIVDLGVAFGRNLGEYSDELVLGPDDLDGLSASFVEQLPPGPDPGSHRVKIVFSMVLTFLEQSSRRDLRELVMRKYLSRAVGENRAILDELLDLRRRAARLMGADSWSQFANEARMSGGRQAVLEFLDRIFTPLRAIAADEQARLREQLRADGYDDELQLWDWFHYHDRQRRELGLEAAELSAHLPLDRVLTGLFDVARDVFGVTVTPVDEDRVWHPSVRVVSLRDAATGEHLADVYLDLFARDGKRPGAWQVPLVEPVTWRGEARRPAVISLVANSPEPVGEGPALLQHDDVATLFHEFGHVLEFGLNRAEGHPANDAWIELDFVEAPSQIMENWIWSPEVLRRFARHHVTGAPPDDALLAPLAATRRLNIATHTLWMLGIRTLLDQYLHGPDAVDTEDAYRRAFAVSGFPFPEGTYWPASFAHIAQVYDAGFYSYLWAQVFGDDMFTAFRDGGLLSPDVGRRYRETVLEPSWSVPGRQRVANFLGREPSEAAFLERLGLGEAVAR